MFLFLMEVFCKLIVRYFIVEIIYDVFEDNKFGEIGFIFKICEIEIYGIFFVKFYIINNMFDF